MRRHEIESDPLIDPQNDASEMGAITEAIRRLPGALRSAAYRHSVSACGPNAEAITGVDHTLSVFDIRSSFGRLLALDAKVVLLGVTYENDTAHHFAEYILKVPDRELIEHSVRLRGPEGPARPPPEWREPVVCVLLYTVIREKATLPRAACGAEKYGLTERFIGSKLSVVYRK